MTKTEAINRVLPKAQELKNNFGLHVSMTIMQIMQESGWLKNAPGNNFLGIKVPTVKINGETVPDPTFPKDRMQLLKTTEWSAAKGWHKVMAWFVKYDSLEACMDRYAKILLLPRYKQTLDSKDWWDSTNYVRENGYATSPAYTDSLRKGILSFKLYEYDWVHAYNEDIIPGGHFSWGETFSNVYYNGRYYYRVIEPYPEYWGNVESMAKLLEIVRYGCGGYPISISSWFRVKSHNAHEGGAPDSQHLYANGADAHKHWKVPMAKFVAEAEKTDATGIGYAKDWLHLDRKKVSKRRTWYY